MFGKKKDREPERDIWGRQPLELYEKIGSNIPRDPKSFNRTIDGKMIHDYFVVFNQEKVDVRGHQELLQAAEWTDYGSKLYRIQTTELIPTIEAMIIDAFHLELKKDFFVSNSTSDPRFIN